MRLIIAVAVLLAAYLYLANGSGQLVQITGGGGSLFNQFGTPAHSVGGAAVGVAGKIGN